MTSEKVGSRTLCMSLINQDLEGGLFGFLVA